MRGSRMVPGQKYLSHILGLDRIFGDGLAVSCSDLPNGEKCFELTHSGLLIAITAKSRQILRQPTNLSAQYIWLLNLTFREDSVAGSVQVNSRCGDADEGLDSGLFTREGE